MAVEVGDIIRVAVKFVWNNADEIVNVWHLIMNDMGSTASDVDVMTEVGETLDTWYNLMQGFSNSAIDGVDVQGQNLTKDELLPAIPFVWTGTGVGQLLPLTVTPMIQFHSPTPRHGSRIYLPPVDETTSDTGLLQAGLLAALATMAGSVLSGFVAAGSGLEFSRVAWDRVFQVARPITAAYIPTSFRTQRRRRQGVGG